MYLLRPRSRVVGQDRLRNNCSEAVDQVALLQNINLFWKTCLPQCSYVLLEISSPLKQPSSRGSSETPRAYKRPEQQSVREIDRLPGVCVVFVMSKHKLAVFVTSPPELKGSIMKENINIGQAQSVKGKGGQNRISERKQEPMKPI